MPSNAIFMRQECRKLMRKKNAITLCHQKDHMKIGIVFKIVYYIFTYNTLITNWYIMGSFLAISFSATTTSWLLFFFFTKWIFVLFWALLVVCAGFVEVFGWKKKRRKKDIVFFLKKIKILMLSKPIQTLYKISLLFCNNSHVILDPGLLVITNLFLENLFRDVLSPHNQ